MAKLVLKSSAKCIVKHPVMSGRRWPTRTSQMKNSKPATVTYGYKKSEKYSSDRERMRRHCTVQSRTGKTTAFSIAILQSMDTTLHMTDPIHILVKRDELTLEGIKQFFVTTITQAVIFCNTEFRSGQSRC